MLRSTSAVLIRLALQTSSFSPDSRNICVVSTFEDAVINKNVTCLFWEVVGFFVEVGCPVKLIIKGVKATAFLSLLIAFLPVLFLNNCIFPNFDMMGKQAEV